jgi:hypothetical protein
MSVLSTGRALAALVPVVLGCPWAARAEVDPPAPPPSAAPATAPAGVSEADVQALMGGLGADAAAAKPTPQASAATPAAGAGGGGGAASALPDIALILDVAGAWFSDDAPLQSGGHDPNHTGFTLQQLEMSLGSNVDPFLRLDANIVFAQFGVEVEEAYATSLALPANLQLRAGQFLTRFGRLNNTHPHAWTFADQPLVNGKFFGSEGNRGMGVELSWLTPLPWYVEIVGSGTEAVGECCARSFYGAEDLGVDGLGDLLYTAALKQFFPFTDALSLMWGLSAQFGPNASGNGNRSEIYGTDLYLRWRPVDSPNRLAISWQTELMHRRRQVPHDRLTDEGGYTQLAVLWTPEWETALRAERVTGVAGDPLDPEVDSPQDKYSAALTFHPSHFSRLRLQGSLGEPGDGRDPIWGALLSLELVAGTHGAHDF